MECIALEGLTFTYPGRQAPALRQVSFAVEQGQFVTLCGRSGCGKTTLLRQLKTVLTPHGTRTGRILLQGKPLEQWDQRAQSQTVGFVMQSPEHQLVTDKVWHELAFVLESLGFKTPEIRARVAETASFFGIESWFYKPVAELSGGQKQLLNLAAVMVAAPSLLLLDEPTSQLDPIAASEFLGMLAKINRELGVTVLLSEQRLEEALPHSNRVIVLDRGAVISDGTPYETGEVLRQTGHAMFLAMPTPMRAWAALPNDMPCPVTVGEGRVWLERLAELRPPDPSVIPDGPAVKRVNVPAVRLSQLWFRYGKEQTDVIRGLSAEIYPGELYAIVGGNGTGKTTALSLISGLLRPWRGRVELFGNEISGLPDSLRYGELLGVLPQNPQSIFVHNTVERDLLEAFSGGGVPVDEQRRRVEQVAKLCELDGLLQVHPYDLSGGEQQRAALARVLLSSPKILLLDEPSKGLDAYFKLRLAEILHQLTEQGTTVIMVSHDIEFCASHAHRCALFFDGGIVSEGAPGDLFSGLSYYTTAASRMARSVLPGAITAEHVILAFGGLLDNGFPPDGGSAPPRESPVGMTKPTFIPEKPAHTGGARAVLAMLALAIPLTILLGMTVLHDRAYYFISLLVLLETMVPFFLLFERRRPQARELVVLAVLCALGVGGRAAFFMLPQVKPMTALVVIAGVCLGGETGFFVGAVTAFCSNLLFGQGPWTPWQMLALGLIGFLAGVVFAGNRLRLSKPMLCLFGGVAALVIYGGIMNPAAVLLTQPVPSLPLILTSYAMGFPFDLIHAVSTALFLWLIGEPMVEKLSRMREKYGILSI